MMRSRHVVWSRHTSQGLIEGVFSWTSAWCMMLWVGHQEVFFASNETLKNRHGDTKERKAIPKPESASFPLHRTRIQHTSILIIIFFKFWVFDVESVQNQLSLLSLLFPVYLLAPFESPAVDCFHPLRGYGSFDLDRCWSGKNVIIRLSYGETKHKRTRFCCLAGVILRGPESFWRDQDTTRWMVFFFADVVSDLCGR